MVFFKSLLGQNEDDRLFDEFLKANQQMNGPQAEKYVERMSDGGLVKATNKIDKLTQTDPGYMILNTFLFAAFTKRPHLRNPFV